MRCKNCSIILLLEKSCTDCVHNKGTFFPEQVSLYRIKEIFPEEDYEVTLMEDSYSTFLRVIHHRGEVPRFLLEIGGTSLIPVLYLILLPPVRVVMQYDFLEKLNEVNKSVSSVRFTVIKERLHGFLRLPIMGEVEASRLLFLMEKELMMAAEVVVEIFSHYLEVPPSSY